MEQILHIAELIPYANKYVRIRTLNEEEQTCTEEINSLYDAVDWTAPERLIDYANGQIQIFQVLQMLLMMQSRFWN